METARQILKKLHTELLYDHPPKIFTPRHIPKRNEKIHLHGSLYTDVDNVIHNSQKVEIVCVSTSRGMVGQNVAYP